VTNDIIRQFCRRVKYSDKEIEKFNEGEHRIRHVQQIAKSASLFSIEVEVVKSCHCNSGHKEGQKFILDVDGSFITKKKKKKCVCI